MKISPYYKAFEEQIVPWDDRLQRVKNILEEWMQVQKKWIYLENIFFGQSDIKLQLQGEYSRF